MWIWTRDFVKWPAPMQGLPIKCPHCCESFARIDKVRSSRKNGAEESAANIDMSGLMSQAGMAEDDPPWPFGSQAAESTVAGYEDGTDRNIDQAIDDDSNSDDLGDDSARDDHGPARGRRRGRGRGRHSLKLTKKRKSSSAGADVDDDFKLRPSRAKLHQGSSYKSVFVQRAAYHTSPEAGASKTEGGAVRMVIKDNPKRPVTDEDLKDYHHAMLGCDFATRYGPDLSGLGGYECNDAEINKHHCQVMFMGVYSDARLGGTLNETLDPTTTAFNPMYKWADLQKVGKKGDNNFTKYARLVGHLCGEGHPNQQGDDGAPRNPSLEVPCKCRGDYVAANRDAVVDYIRQGPGLTVAKSAKPKGNLACYAEGTRAQKEKMEMTALGNLIKGWDNYVPLVEDPARERYLLELAVVELWTLGPPVRFDAQASEEEQKKFKEQCERARAIVRKHRRAETKAQEAAVALEMCDESHTDVLAPMHDDDDTEDPEAALALMAAEGAL